MPNLAQRILQALTPWYSEEEAEGRLKKTQQEVNEATQKTNKANNMIRAYRVYDAALERKKWQKSP